MSEVILNFPADAHIFTYPGGESQVRIFLTPEIEKLKGDHGIATVCAHIRSAKDIVELALFCEAIEGINIAAELRLILPYLPYARADRRFVEGDCLGLRTFGSILASLSPGEIRSLDVHSKQAEVEIDGLIDVPPTPLINRAVVNWAKGTRWLDVLFPDEGAHKRYGGGQAFGAAIEGIRLTQWHATKKRDAVTGKLSGFEVPLKHNFGDNQVLIVDDICDGGATFIGIADELGLPRERLALYVTHGIFSKGLDELKKRFGRIYCSNSFDHRDSPDNDDFLIQYDCWDLLYKYEEAEVTI